jgi:hypothetical protein
MEEVGETAVAPFEAEKAIEAETREARQAGKEGTCSANEATETVGMEKMGHQKISSEERHSGGLARAVER